MKKKIAASVAVAALFLAVAVPSALAYKEGPGTDWWYVDASYGDYHDSVPLVIELDGDSSAGQTFLVGDTVEITVDLHSYAASCAGYANEAFLEWLLEVDGPSGYVPIGDLDDAHSNGCAEAEEDGTLVISYVLSSPGTHTVYMSSYAAVAQYWTDVADDFVDASLTFVVLPTEMDQCKNGGWENFNNLFRNQGDCVSFVRSSDNAVGNRRDNEF